MSSYSTVQATETNHDNEKITALKRSRLQNVHGSPKPTKAAIQRPIPRKTILWSTIKFVRMTHRGHMTYSVSQKKFPPPRGPDISHFSQKRLRIFNRFFTHLSYVPIYARLQIFIQSSPTLTKLCHIKRDYPVHIICAKCPKRARSDVCVSHW